MYCGFKEFLGLRVITSNDFSTTLLLFAIAVAPEPIYHDKNNILNQDNKSQDTVIDTLIAMHFNEHSGEEQSKIKLILKELLLNNQDKDIVNYLNIDLKVLKTIMY